MDVGDPWVIWPAMPRSYLLDTKVLPLSTPLKNEISTLGFIKEKSKYKIWLLKKLIIQVKNCIKLWKSRITKSQGTPRKGRKGRGCLVWGIQQNLNMSPDFRITLGVTSWLHYLLGMYAWERHYISSSFSFPSKNDKIVLRIS